MTQSFHCFMNVKCYSNQIVSVGRERMPKLTACNDYRSYQKRHVYMHKSTSIMCNSYAIQDCLGYDNTFHHEYILCSQIRIIMQSDVIMHVGPLLCTNTDIITLLLQ